MAKNIQNALLLQIILDAFIFHINDYFIYFLAPPIKQCGLHEVLLNCGSDCIETCETVTGKLIIYLKNVNFSLKFK